MFILDTIQERLHLSGEQSGSHVNNGRGSRNVAIGYKADAMVVNTMLHWS